jgi:hypothetical protein
MEVNCTEPSLHSIYHDTKLITNVKCYRLKTLVGLYRTIITYQALSYTGRWQSEQIKDPFLEGKAQYS